MKTTLSFSTTFAASKAVLVSFVLLTGGMILAPVASAAHGQNSCSFDTSYQYSCTFACHAGEYIRFTLEAPPGYYTSGEARCGGAYVSCSGYGGCTAQSEGAAWYTDTYDCRSYYSYTQGKCETFTRTTYGVGAISTPGRDAGPVYTPGVGKTCTPSGIVCVGPVDPIFVANLPGVPSVGLTPAVGVTIERIERPLDPTVENKPVGPIAVTGPPVPITVCDTPCDLPGGIRSHPAITLEIFVGGTKERITILP